MNKKPVKTLTEQIVSIFTSHPKDITAAIKIDHKSLKSFLAILKDTDAKMSERRLAYESFASLLKSHTKAEEEVLYNASFKLTGKEMHIKVEEGFVEHKMAKDLMKRLDSAIDPLEWSAHANVLSEIVEHHLREEERDLLPLFKDQESPKLGEKLLKQFMAIRSKSQTKVNKKNAGVLKKKK